jgi:cytochrome c oxidase subunit 3
MGSTVTTEIVKKKRGGGMTNGASYGKLMMWFFIVSDALTFSGFCSLWFF